MPSTGLSLNFPDVVYAKVRVEFDKYKIKTGDTITLTFVGKNTMPAPCEVYIHLNLPEGWTADREEFPLYLHEMRMRLHTTTTVRVTATENVKAVHHRYADLAWPDPFGDPSGYSLRLSSGRNQNEKNSCGLEQPFFPGAVSCQAAGEPMRLAACSFSGSAGGGRADPDYRPQCL